MKSATGSFEGFDAYDDKWFPSAMKYISGKKCNLSIICLILYNCVKFQHCMSIYEEDINNSKKYLFFHKNYLVY